MNSSEIRQRFLYFFEKRGHTIIQSASLVTTDEKGLTNATLFNTAGMQPLIPYLLGKPYVVDGKEVTRLVNVQKCLRTVDIDDIGDKVHATFFEMLGNWSLGDYFKKEAILWSYEFLTNPIDAAEGDRGLGLDPSRLYITVFEGDNNAPRDDKAAEIWREVFKKNKVEIGGDTSKGEAGRIFYMPADKNWWEAGDNGPCGPDTEMYYDIGNVFKGEGITREQFIKADEARDVVEVWNDVFMQYEKKDGKIIGNLPKPSVDTGAGLERLAMTLQGVDNIYDTDLLKPIIDAIKSKNFGWNMKTDIPIEKSFVYEKNLKGMRIVADHTRAAIFIVSDGVTPSNTGRGYILRRLIRRAVFHCTQLNLQIMPHDLVGIVAEIYKDSYPDFTQRSHEIVKIINEEEIQFLKTISSGLKELQKLFRNYAGNIKEFSLSADQLFDLYQTHGFPLELSFEEIDRQRKHSGSIEVPNNVKKILADAFRVKMLQHQALSRSGAEQKFKGGLADANDPMVVRYHTATHLLQQALHDVLGEEVGNQKGSNITAERLRYDFTGVKLTDEQKKKVEAIVNDKIRSALPVNQVILSRTEAEKTGARHFFGEKYGDQISVYFIGKDLDSAYSKEFCGGPHVKNTGELAGPEGKWKFKIQKEEASSQGVRRIKAVLDN